jgi:hypothetical protein
MMACSSAIFALMIDEGDDLSFLDGQVRPFWDFNQAASRSQRIGWMPHGIKFWK